MIETLSYADFKNVPRGMKLNNPLLVKKSKQEWIGKAKNNTDRSFEQFDYYWQGLHAALRIIQKYYFEENANTIEKLIFKFARPGTGVTPYIQAVSTGAGLRPRQVFKFNRETIFVIMCEISRYELKGRNPMIHPDIFAFVWLKI